MPRPEDIPKLEILASTSPHHQSALRGWEDFLIFAIANNATVREGLTRGMYERLAPEDGYKLVVAALFAQNLELVRKLNRYIELYGIEPEIKP